ncbi:VanZ family protein [Paenibacillus terrigena]|uniref:VanZ family protein n=1 Tax=Paenibacillus terrigena TaxID=369333 RepID=UPI0028D69AE9|nr:VanZ family protein [Paenibacillus terrigena]
MNFEQYTSLIVQGLPCSKREKRDMQDELKDHLTELHMDLIEEGCDEHTASAMAIERFGKPQFIRNQLCHALPIVDKYMRKWILALFILYTSLLSYVMLLSSDRWARRAFTIEWKRKMLEYGHTQSMHLYENTVPFHTLRDYIVNHHRYTFTTIFLNLFGNIGVFIPIGLLLPLLFPYFRSIHRIFLASFTGCVLIEMLQYAFTLGSFDVDDLILNLIGGMMGFGCYKVIHALVNQYKHVKFQIHE